jgi:hypothetical protein
MVARSIRILLVLVLTLLAVTARQVGMTTHAAMTYPQTVLSDNPVSYWRLNETSGTIAQDQRGLNPGTITGGVTLGQPSPVAGGASMSFDGSTGYIEAPDSSSLDTPSTAVTIEAWVKPANGSLSSQKPLLLKSFTSHSPPFYQYGLFMTDNGILANDVSLYMSIGGNFATVDVQNSGWQYGTWSHIVGTYDGTSMAVYVNGVLKGSKAQSGLLDHYPTVMDIGAYANLGKTAQYLFGGISSDLR